MSTEIDVRHATSADAATITAIYNHAIEERQATFETRPRSPQEIVRWIGSDERFPVMVATHDGAIVGWARIARYSEREAYAGVGEYQAYVHPAHRRRGVGARLTRATADEAERQGYWKLIGRPFTTNEASIALLRHCDFRDVGVHICHGQLDGQWKDVLVMELLMRGRQGVAQRSP